MTRRARILDCPAGAATDVARPGHREEALLITNLARAAASRTTFRLRSCFGAGTLARIAGFQTRNTQLRRHSLGGFFERDLQVVTEIGAALGRRTPATAAPAAKH